MAPWEVAEHLVTTTDQASLLQTLSKDDPFWIGTSYAIDPFVGVVYRLPLSDPFRYGPGVNPQVFDKLVRYILDGKLTGDDLALAVEQFSKHCQPDEWLQWYRPILQGALNLKLPLELFNQYCPDEFRVPLPAIHRPKPIGSLSELPTRFVLQPAYPDDRVLWFVNSQYEPIEIRGYDSRFRRYENPVVEDLLEKFGQSNRVDAVITGYASKDRFLVDDVLGRDHFARESSTYMLHQRLAVLVKLGLPTVQLSEILTPEQTDSFYREFNLILEQRYDGVIIRDIDAHYPFRVQADRLAQPTVKGIVYVSEIVPEVGIFGDYQRGSKTLKTMVRLGLNNGTIRNISKTQTKANIVSCGVRSGELLLPVFKGWKDE